MKLSSKEFKFKRGQQVTLKVKYASSLDRSNKKAIDWLGRKGIVVSCNARTVSIRWEDRRSLDWVPIAAVMELLEAKGDEVPLDDAGV